MAASGGYRCRRAGTVLTVLPDFDPAVVPADQIPAALTTLAGWQTQLAARLMKAPATAAAPQANEQDRMLTTAEAAEMLRKSTKWLYRHAETLQFARRLPGRGLLFSKAGIVKWLARQKA